MIFNVALVAVLGAIGASAANPHAIKRVLASRQLTASDIPSACQSQCQGALTVYDACMNGDTNTCLGICQPTQFADYRSCLSCILDNNPQATSENVQAVNQALDELEQLCDSVGSTVSAADFSATGGAVGGSGTLAASSTAAGGVSAVSSAAAATTSGPRSGDESTPSGVVASVGSAINSVSRAASGAVSSAAATTSGAAAYAARFPNMAGFAVAVVGVVAGAAVVL